MLQFYGRNKELNNIYEVLDNDKQQNILVYGRRRVGKSFLIRKALEKYKDKKVIIYQCKNIDFLSLYQNSVFRFLLSSPYIPPADP